MRRDLIITHGLISHSIDSADDCMTCIEINIEWYKELKFRGGITKLKEKYLNLSNKLKEV